MKKLFIILCSIYLISTGCSKKKDLIPTSTIGSSGIAKMDSLNRFELLSVNFLPYYIKQIIIENNNNTGWFATETGGLFKKSGTTWTQYLTSNSDIPSNRCNSMVLDNNTLYICTPNGFAVFDGNNWTNFNSINSGLIYDNLNHVAIDINGDLWMVSYDKIYKYVNGIIVPYVLGNQPSYIYDIAVNQNGKKFLITDIGLISFDSSGENLYSGLMTHSFEIGIDNNNFLWIVGPGGLQKFNGKEFINYDPPVDAPFAKSFFAIDFDSYNNIWIGSSGSSYNGALLQFTPHNAMWRYLMPISKSPFDSYSITEIFIDNLGNKWISSVASSTISIYNNGGVKY